MKLVAKAITLIGEDDLDQISKQLQIQLTTKSIFSHGNQSNNDQLVGKLVIHTCGNLSYSRETLGSPSKDMEQELG